jgi:hypothetical protein
MGLIWVLWSGRGLSRSTLEPLSRSAADAKVDLGLRAGGSRRLGPVPPIPSDRLTTVGKPIRVGSLEVLPLKITAGPVVLERIIDPNETHEESLSALRLRVRLRNVSRDAVFAPLDEAFLRDGARGEPDTLIDAGQGRRIEMFPLAVESEWRIQGQKFREFGPGETFETAVVSKAGVLSSVTTEMTWRVRLRTGINQTDVLGVRFSAEQIGDDP